MSDIHEEMKRLQRDTDDFIALCLLDWAEGRAVWSAASALMADALRTGHGLAHALGRNLAGDADAYNDQDQAAGDAVWAGEKPYWDSFGQDVLRGDYGSPVDAANNPPQTEAITERAQRYVNKLAATGNAAWVAALLGVDEDALFDWVLDPAASEVHCEDCPNIAGASPWAAGELPTVPGAGDTECLFNCRCELKAHESGDMGFPVR